MVRNAYVRWKNLDRFDDLGRCCGTPHLDSRGQWKSDEHVCDRERAWRCYVRLRDANPKFPYFVKIETFAVVPNEPNRVPQSLIDSINHGRNRD